MKKRLLILASLLGLFVSPSVWAQATVYEITEPVYMEIRNFSGCMTGPCANFPPGSRVTGQLTTAAPLASNLPSGTIINPQVTSFSFNDGINTYSSTDPNVRGNVFAVSTDAGGNITIASKDLIRVTLWQTGSSPHAVGDRVAVIIIGAGFHIRAINNARCRVIDTSVGGVSDSCEETGGPRGDHSASRADAMLPGASPGASPEATVYSFTGGVYVNISNFTSPCATGPCANFPPGSRTTGQITTAMPLASNLSHVVINPTSFYFTDGLNTYSSANPNVRGNLFQVSTDAGGNIILSGSDYIRITLWQTGSSPHAVGDRVASIDYSTGSLLATNNSPCAMLLTGDKCTYGQPDKDASTSQAYSYGPGTWSRQSVAITLGGYLSGNWFNSAQPGHGFQLEFTNQLDGTVPSENEMVAIWFVYTPDGTGQQNWIYAQGPYDSTQNTVTLPATIFHGARFPFPLTNYNPADVKGSLGDWGTLTFTFIDCNNGTASWNSMVTGYGNGSTPITRLTSIQGTTCP